MSLPWHPPVGCIVQLFGLNRADLNGLQGTIAPKDYGIPQDRVGVRIDIGGVCKRIAVKLKNIKATDAKQLKATLKASNLKLMTVVGNFCAALPGPVKNRIWGFLRNAIQLEMITHEGLYTMSLQSGRIDWATTHESLYMQIPEGWHNLVDKGSYKEFVNGEGSSGRMVLWTNQLGPTGCGPVYSFDSVSFKVIQCTGGFSVVRLDSIQCIPACFEWVKGKRPIPCLQPMSMEGANEFKEKTFEIVLQHVHGRTFFNPDKVFLARDGTWAAVVDGSIWTMDLSSCCLQMQCHSSGDIPVCVHGNQVLAAVYNHAMKVWQCSDLRIHEDEYHCSPSHYIKSITSGVRFVALLVYTGCSAVVELLTCRELDHDELASRSREKAKFPPYVHYMPECIHIQKLFTVPILGPEVCVQAICVGQGMLATVHKRSHTLDARNGNNSSFQRDDGVNKRSGNWDTFSIEVWNYESIPQVQVLSMDVTPSRPPSSPCIRNPMLRVGVWPGATPKLSDMISLLEEKARNIDMEMMERDMNQRQHDDDVQIVDSPIEEVHMVSSEPVAKITPEEAAAIQHEQWASSVEQLIHQGPIVNRDDMSRNGRCVLLEFNRGTKELEDAILRSAPACRAQQQGVDVQPLWANGAKVLVDGITSDDFDRLGTVLRPRHVVIYEAETMELLRALENLSFRIRKLKSGCGKRVLTSGSLASSYISEFLSDDGIADEDLASAFGEISVFGSDDDHPTVESQTLPEYTVDVRGTFVDFRSPSSKLTRHTI